MKTQPSYSTPISNSAFIAHSREQVYTAEPQSSELFSDGYKLFFFFLQENFITKDPSQSVHQIINQIQCYYSMQYIYYVSVERPIMLNLSGQFYVVLESDDGVPKKKKKKRPDRVQSWFSKVEPTNEYFN